MHALLSELSAQVQLNGQSIASQLLGTSATSGMDLINKVLADPQILWKKAFFQELATLPPDQIDVVFNWFKQMVDLQAVYITEIEKANDYLKMMVCRSFDSLHTSDAIKEEFIAKINHIENRHYFHRKRTAILRSRDQPSFSSQMDGERRRRSKSRESVSPPRRMSSTRDSA